MRIPSDLPDNAKMTKKIPTPVLSVDIEKCPCILGPICTSERQDGDCVCPAEKDTGQALPTNSTHFSFMLSILRPGRVAAACTVSPVLPPVTSSSRSGVLYTWQWPESTGVSCYSCGDEWSIPLCLFYQHSACLCKQNLGNCHRLIRITALQDARSKAID